MKRLLLIPILLLGFGSSAQVLMTGSGSYSQNFNTLASTGTNPWTDNSVIPNVYSQRSGTGAGNYIADAGTSTNGTIYSYGTTAATERALGAIGSNGAGNFAHGILFQNTSGGVLSDFTVSYVLEQWRNGGNATAQDVTFWYKVSSSSFTALNPGVNTGWTQVTALTASSPINTATAAALDGDQAANRVALSSILIPGLSLNAGEYIMIKWEDINHPSNDHGLAIDDIAISWTAAATPCTNTTATIDTVSCAASYTVPSGDEMYNVGGTYMDTIPNANGCDSILTINLSFVASINYYPDTDGDGLGDNSAAAVPACTPPANHVNNNSDCDDTNPAIGVGITYYADTDTDGFGDPATATVSCTPLANHVTNDDDCDDTDNAIGMAQTYYQDLDGDTYGNPAVSVTQCIPPANYVLDNTDCNDNAAAVHPGATEIPNNGIDEDCNGSDLNTIGTTLGMYEFQGNNCPIVPAAMNITPPQPANATFGPYAVTGSSLVCQSAADVINFAGFNTSGTVDPTQYYSFNVTPANCYGLDLNRIIFLHKTSNTGGTPTVHLRSSLDNFAADIATKTLPNSTAKTDTIDLPAAFDNITAAIEFRWYITGIGQTGSTYRHDNVRVLGNTNALPTQTYYADTDGDGYGDPAASQTACSAPVGYVSDNTDCDDTNEEEFPGAVWYADADGDGLGDAGSSQIACLQPANHVSNDTDCNDNDDQIGAEEMYYTDADGDGFGDADDAGTVSCTPVTGSVTNNDDCDDDDEDINPSATEVCDGLDNNCDGDIDEGFTMLTYYEDADNDTYGDPASSVTDCTQPAGYVTNDDDCDDSNAAIHPGATDNTGNMVDENCDGVDGVLGIEESILANLNVYPNPGTSSVVLNMSNGWNGFQVAFAGVDGKEIALTSVQKSANELEFNTNSLVPGVYFIRLTSASGTALVRWVKN